jgi:hypothetical protein
LADAGAAEATDAARTAPMQSKTRLFERGEQESMSFAVPGINALRTSYRP